MNDVQPLFVIGQNGKSEYQIKIANLQVLDDMIGRSVLAQSRGSSNSDDLKLIGGILPIQNYECQTVNFYYFFLFSLV